MSSSASKKGPQHTTSAGEMSATSTHPSQPPVPSYFAPQPQQQPHQPFPYYQQGPPMQMATTRIPPPQQEERLHPPAVEQQQQQPQQQQQQPPPASRTSMWGRGAGGTAYMHAPQSKQRGSGSSSSSKRAQHNPQQQEFDWGDSSASAPPVAPTSTAVTSHRALLNIDRQVGLGLVRAEKYADMERSSTKQQPQQQQQQQQQQQEAPQRHRRQSSLASRRYEADANAQAVSSSDSGSPVSPLLQKAGQQQPQQMKPQPISQMELDARRLSLSAPAPAPPPSSSSMMNLNQPMMPEMLVADSAVVSSPQAGRFQVLRHQPIGSGGFGTVYMGFDTMNGTHVAVKESNLPLNSGAAVECLEAEFSVLDKLSHPNIVKVFQHRIDTQLKMSQIFMEWMSSGSVKSIIDQTGFRLHENVIRRYTLAALEGLAYLHSKNVLHRDVKPANMLVGGDGVIKLSDFGTSKATQNNQTATTTQHVVGTCAYMAPESITRGKYSPASDMWALGCSIVEMATGRPPWDELPTEQRQSIPMMFYIGTAQPPNHHPRIPGHLSSQLKALIELLFAHDAKERTSASSIRNSPYFNQAALPEDAEPLNVYRAAVQDALTKRANSSIYGFSSSEGVSHSYDETGAVQSLLGLATEGMVMGPTDSNGSGQTTTASTGSSAVTSSGNPIGARQDTSTSTSGTGMFASSSQQPRKYKDIHVEAAQKIQALSRMVLARSSFLQQRKAVKRIQTLARRYLYKVRKSQNAAAATTIYPEGVGSQSYYF